MIVFGFVWGFVWWGVFFVFSHVLIFLPTLSLDDV